MNFFLNTFKFVCSTKCIADEAAACRRCILCCRQIEIVQKKLTSILKLYASSQSQRSSVKGLSLANISQCKIHNIIVILTKKERLSIAANKQKYHFLICKQVDIITMNWMIRHIVDTHLYNSEPVQQKLCAENHP